MRINKMVLTGFGKYQGQQKEKIITQWAIFDKEYLEYINWHGDYKIKEFNCSVEYLAKKMQGIDISKLDSYKNKAFEGFVNKDKDTKQEYLGNIKLKS